MLDVQLGVGFKYMFGSLFGEDSHFDSYFSDWLVQPPSSSTSEGFFHVAAWDQEIAEIQQRIQKTHHATNEKVGIFLVVRATASEWICEKEWALENVSPASNLALYTSYVRYLC